MLQMIDLEITESVLLYHCLWCTGFICGICGSKQVSSGFSALGFEQSLMEIIVQLVDHERNVLAQVYIDVVWTG